MTRPRVKMSSGGDSGSERGKVRVREGKVACVSWLPQEEVALWWCGSGQCEGFREIRGFQGNVQETLQDRFKFYP